MINILSELDHPEVSDYHLPLTEGEKRRYSPNYDFAPKTPPVHIQREITSGSRKTLGQTLREFSLTHDLDA